MDGRSPVRAVLYSRAAPYSITGLERAANSLAPGRDLRVPVRAGCPRP